MALKETVAANARARRIELGMTQKEFAERCGLDVRYVNRLERNPQNLTLEIVETIATALDCSVAELVGDGKVVSTTAKSLEAFDQALQTFTAFRSRLKVRD